MAAVPRWRVGLLVLLASLPAHGVGASDSVAVANRGLEGRVGGKRTLVLVDSLEVKDTHSLFLDALETRGHQLTYKLADAADVVLQKYGEYVYDNLIYFAPGTEEMASLDVNAITRFVESGGNILVAATPEMSDFTRDLAGEFGVDFDKKKSRVMDHFSHEPALDQTLQHTAVVTSEFLKNPQVLGSFATRGDAPVVYSGVGHALEEDNIFALKVLTGASSSYSAFVGKEVASQLENVGRDTLLVSAIQARNNARAVFSGSLDLFSNHYFTSTLTSTGKVAGNREFAVELSKWALGERGILRASNVSHHRADGSSPDHLLAAKVKPELPISLFPDPELNRESLVYRIKDDVVYSLVVEEYDADYGGWRPYVSHDMQLELVMLDPYIRTGLTCDPATGRYSVQVKIPDAHGVYKFRVMYRRPGYSTLTVNTVLSIRPFRHDEYERFIFSAYPYYTSAFSMMAGFFIFSFFFLYSR